MTQGRVTRPRFFNFAIRLRLDSGYKALIFASMTNLESGPLFADIWSSALAKTLGHDFTLQAICNIGEIVVRVSFRFEKKVNKEAHSIKIKLLTQEF